MDKTILTIGGITLAVVGFIAYITINQDPDKQTALTESGPIISTEGIHWHADLSINIKGQPVEIPADVGLGEEYASTPWYNPSTKESDIHTHDTTGEIHWEIANGPVSGTQVMIGSFFTVWGKIFNQNQILDSINGEGGTVKMLVNGQPNMEFENYVIRDGDKIEIRYE